MIEYENIIKANAKEYYTTGTQKLSDEVFDALVEEVRNINPTSEVLSTGWGFKPESEDKVKHKYCHIGSLKKATKIEQIYKQQNNCNCFNIAAKLDGMSCVLYYEKGKLLKALTRGDGEYGLDITEKLHYVKGFKYDIRDRNFTGAVRGELFMTPEDYKKYKLKYSDAKNARNSTAGIINSKIGTVSPEDYGFISLFVYTVVASEQDMSSYNCTAKLNEWLKLNFEYVVPYVQKSNIVLEDLIKLKEEYTKEVVIDGLVITNYKVNYNKETKNFDYNQIAFKFEDEVKITTVKEIQWTMSKNQAYIPVIIIEPIELEGTQVQRVTGYNAKWVQDMNIKKDSIVAVRKAHQIIPQIIEVVRS